MRLAYLIVEVSDMKRSVAFYKDTAGLPLKFESPDWTEFATGSTSLALHLADSGSTAGPGMRSNNCRPGLQVPDLVAFHSRMLACGVECIREPVASFGVRIAQYADPDGLTVSVSQQS